MPRRSARCDWRNRSPRVASPYMSRTISRHSPDDAVIALPPTRCIDPHSRRPATSLVSKQPGAPSRAISTLLPHRTEAVTMVILARLTALACCVLLLQAVGVAQAPAASDWQALDQQATDLYVQGDLPKAIVAAEQALRVASSPRESGRSLDRLGFLHYTSGRLAEGEKYLRESLRVRQEAFGIDSLEYAETAND